MEIVDQRHIRFSNYSEYLAVLTKKCPWQKSPNFRKTLTIIPLSDFLLIHGKFARNHFLISRSVNQYCSPEKMNTPAILLVFQLAIGAGAASAAVVLYQPVLTSEVIPSRDPNKPPTITDPRAEDDLNIDIDRDGIAELRTFVTTDISASYQVRPDVLEGLGGTPIGPFSPHLSFSNALFSSVGALLASDFLRLDLVLPAYTDRYSNSGNGIIGLSPSNPVSAMWMIGSSGDGTDPVSVTGIVVDYSQFYGSGGTDPVRVYTHSYGSFLPAELIPTFSLLATGVPEPSTPLLLVLATVGLMRRNRRGEQDGGGQPATRPESK